MNSLNVSLWREKISRRGSNWSFCIILSVVLIISGFFVFAPVLADHTTTVTVDPTMIKGGISDTTYTFTISNDANSTNFIYYIQITAPAGFTINNALACPSDWTSLGSATEVTCTGDPDPSVNKGIQPGTNATISFVATSPNADLNSPWVVQTKDNAFYSVLSYPVTLVDITSPSTNDSGTDANWHQGSIEVTLTANDNESGSGVANTYYCVGSGDTCVPTQTYDVETGIVVASEGINYIRYYSIDNVENTETVKLAANTVKIDNTPPITQIVVSSGVSYSTEPTYIKSDTQFSLSADDGAGSGIVLTEYKIDSGDWISYTTPFTVSDAGTHTIHYRSKDAVENQEADKTLSVFVDDTEPVVGEITIEPYSEGTTNYVSGSSDISANISDEGSGVVGCEYTLDGITWTPANYNGGNCSVSGVNTVSASVINIRAKDNVDNEGTGTTPITVTPDTIAPSTTDSGIDTIWHNDDVAVTLTANDIDSGIASTKYCVDFANICTPDQTYNAVTGIIVSNEGINYIRYNSMDNVDNAEAVKSAANTVKIDKSVPLIGPIVITYPNDQTKAKNGDTITVSAVVNDTYSGLDTVFLDASSIGGGDTIPMILINGSYTADVTVTGTNGDSTETLIVTATDIVTNSDSNTGDVEIDNTLPNISNYTLNDQTDADAYFNPDLDSVSVTVNASEVVDWVSLKIYNAANESIYKTFASIPDGQSVSVIWDGTLIGGTLEDGQYIIKAHIKDVAGNDVDNIVLSDYKIYVDTTDPIVNISSPTDGAIVRDSSGNVSVVFSADDTNDVSCSYKINGGSEIPMDGCVSPAIISVPDGRHTITLIARDPTNNEGSDSVAILMDSNNTFTVDDTPANNPDFATIQDAIANAQDGYTISVADGDYTLNSTLNLNLTGLTISGDSESEVVIDASNVSGYGIAPSADNITLERFTLIGPAADAGTSYGIKASHISSFTMRNVTVQGSGRSEFDLNTVNEGLLENITAEGENTGGVGVALSHSNNITLRDITTQDNNWGGVGLYDTAEGQTTNVIFEGTNNFGEDNPIYIDAEYGAGVSYVKLPTDFDYAVRNTTFRDGEGADRSEAFTFYQKALADAVNFALSLQTTPFPVNTDSHIQTLGRDTNGYVYLENNFEVGNGMSIQTAVNAALSDTTINVATGVYNEGLIDIDKNLTIIGDISNKPILNPTEDTRHSDHRGWIQVAGDVDVTIKNLVIDGQGKNVENAIRYQDDASGTVENCDISNIKWATYNGMGIVVVDYTKLGGGELKDISPEFYVKNSTFSNIERVGVSCFGVDKCYLQDNIYTGKGNGDWLDYGVEIGGGGIATLSGNEISNCKGVASVDGSTSAGILVTTYYGEGTTATIQGDNKLHDNTEGIAIGYDENDSSTVTVNGNEIYNNGKGIGTSDSASISLTVNNNKIYNNSEKGIDAINGPSVDAKYNWWGTPAEDEIQTMISVNVDYGCWYLDSDKTKNSCEVSLDEVYVYTSTSACEVNNDQYEYAGFNCFDTIQEGIDAVNEGGTVDVAAGTYNENVVIDKQLTLKGANAGIPATEGRGLESIINAQGVPIAVLINGADTVATFDGFTVDNYDTIGILAGAFKDILQEVPLGDDPVAVHILNNIVMPPTIAPPHNNNIQVGVGTTGTIIGNEVSGALLESPDWTGSGILVAGSSDVVVLNNYAHDCESGIVIVGYAVYRDAPAENNLVENNLVEDSETGISVQMNSIGTVIRYNDVLNNTDIGIGSVGNISWEPTIPSGTEIHSNDIVGNVNYGVKSSVWDSNLGDPEQVDATNNWWGSNKGPYHSTNEGSQNNEVSDYVDFRPWCKELDCTSPEDSTVPEVTDGSQTPPDGAVGVSLLPTVSLGFNEEVQCGAGSDWSDCFSIDSATGSFDYPDNTLTFTPDSNLDYNTEYTVDLTDIIDLAGNFLGDVSWSFITLTDYLIPLKAGDGGEPHWNLISIPTVPSQGTEISAVLGDAESSIDSVWRYDAQTDDWDVYHVNGEPNTSDLDTMEPGYGYWIKVTSATAIEGEGSLFGQQEDGDSTPPGNMPSVNLINGWNLIGYYQRAGDEDAPISSALSTLVDKWTTLITYINGSSVPLYSDTTVDPGEAFWAFLTENTPYGPGNKYTE